MTTIIPDINLYFEGLMLNEVRGVESRIAELRSKPLTKFDESEICFLFGKLAALRTVKKKNFPAFKCKEEIENSEYAREMLRGGSKREEWESFHYWSGQMVGYQISYQIVDKKEDALNTPFGN